MARQHPIVSSREPGDSSRYFVNPYFDDADRCNKEEGSKHVESQSAGSSATTITASTTSVAGASPPISSQKIPPLMNSTESLECIWQLFRKCQSGCEEDYRNLLHERQIRQQEALYDYYGSLYRGALGARVFLPWKLATTVYRSTADQDGSPYNYLLEQVALPCVNEAMEAVNAIDVAGTSFHRKMMRRVTLLESPWVGATVMHIVIHHELAKRKDATETTSRASALAEKLVQVCDPLHFPREECDVLYGRAGAIQAILFLRQAIPGDRTEELTTDCVLTLARDIIAEGQRYAASQRPNIELPLLWKWHDTHYLGAAHGVVGILHTLLCLSPQELSILNEEFDIHNKIQQTIKALYDKYCWPSGNLDSSIKDPRYHRHQRVDRLVHWCHGATGHVLLLMKAYEVYKDIKYMQRAAQIADNVLWKRGLLKKGVGLCHGISGNAYALQAVGRYENRAVTTRRVHAFARFALEHLSSLENVPDDPYSLYNGLAGFCTLLIDVLMYDAYARFPLYDY